MYTVIVEVEAASAVEAFEKAKALGNPTTVAARNKAGQGWFNVAPTPGVTRTEEDLSKS